MTLEEIKQALKDDHSIDLDSLLAPSAEATEAPASDLVAALSAALSSTTVKLSAGDNPEAVVAAVSAIADENVKLSSRVEKLEADAVAKEVEDYIRSGHIVPAKREAMIKLSKLDRELFMSLIPTEPVVKLSAEAGLNPSDEPTESDLNQDIERLVALAAGKAGK